MAELKAWPWVRRAHAHWNHLGAVFPIMSILTEDTSERGVAVGSEMTQQCLGY